VRVEIKYYGLVFEATNVREEKVDLPENSSVRGLLQLLVLRYKKLKKYLYNNFQLVDYLMIAVNDVDIVSLDKYDTVLREGDKVYLMPPIGGG
jgi:MoaD family protein